MPTPTQPDPTIQTEGAPNAPQTTTQIAEAALAELLQGKAAEEPPAPSAAPATPPAPAAAPAAATPPAEDPNARALAQIARREAELLKQREAFRAEQAETLKRAEAAKAAAADPLAYLKSLGYEGKKLMDLAGTIYATAAGQDAPKELKEQLQGMETRSEVARVKAELEQLRAEREAERKAQAEAVERYQRQQTLTAELEKVPEEKSKHVRALLKEQPAMVQAQLLQMAEEHKATYGEDPDPVDLANRFEQQLVQMLKPFLPLYAAPPAPPPQAAPTAAPTPPAKTLNDSLITRTPPKSRLADDPAARLEELLPKWSAGHPLD